MYIRFATLIACSLVATHMTAVYGQNRDRNTMVLDDRTRVLQDGFWIYNDVEKGLEQARVSGRPLMVIFRCIPCEACAQLDEQVLEKNPAVRKWLSKFECVRVVHTNGMDLSRFQFDYDQSWAAFFLNGDGTIYGRYGTRSHQHESDNDVTLEGFLDTLNEVLELHQRYPEVKEPLKAKTGEPVAVASPEEFPSLRERYSSSLQYGPEVARSCIHCHQVGEAWREWYRGSDQPIPENVIFPYPHPKILGLHLDPQSAVTVASVEPGSWSETAGFQSGDKVVAMAGQPMVSMADIQWVLHNAPRVAELSTTVERDGSKLDLTLSLPQGWRETGDISWRATSWPLRRMVTGGLRLISSNSEKATELGVSSEAPAQGVSLVVDMVGQWNAAAAGKRAGFEVGDVIVSVDGLRLPMSESQLFAHLLRTKKPGDTLAVEILRKGKMRTLKLPIQE